MTREELIEILQKLPVGTEVFVRQERGWLTGLFLSGTGATPRVRAFEVGRGGISKVRAFLEASHGPDNANAVYAGDLGCAEWTF